MSDTAAVNDHLAELESELERLSKSVDEIHAAQEAATEAVSASKEVLSALKQVTSWYQKQQERDMEIGNEIHEVLDKISQVDFPSRLDKLDNTVSAVNLGVQNLRTDIQHLSQKFEEVEDHFASLHHALMLQRGMSFVIAALVVGGLIASLLLS
ncbi:hypothetical protein J7K60_00825 [Candidatus Bipolaricaulota bacterium]|nr:hypothetical protein [Candidatus Bipolaricaulota bacterium]